MSIELKHIRNIERPLRSGRSEGVLTSTDNESVCAPSDDQVDRPSIRGAYKPHRTGTIRGSIFALLASVLGTGNLNLPFRL